MVLLVIDAQQGICNEKLYRFDAFVSTVQTLISVAREKDVEVVFVRHDDGEGKLLTKGNAAFAIFDAFAPLPSEKIFDKKVNIVNDGTNPLIKLKNNENILQFLSFSSKIMDSKFGAIFSKDINRLHYILGDSYQLFIPQNDKI